MWSQSPPAVKTRFASTPKEAKSLANMDGQIMAFGETVEVLLLFVEEAFMMGVDEGGDVIEVLVVGSCE